MDGHDTSSNLNLNCDVTNAEKSPPLSLYLKYPLLPPSSQSCLSRLNSKRNIPSNPKLRKKEAVSEWELGTVAVCPTT